MRIRDATQSDAEALASIYNQGIEARTATFETGMRDAAERSKWLEAHDSHHPVIVAEDATGRVVGWAAITPISDRPCYRGVGEYSVYIRRENRGAGLGTKLVQAIMERASALGYWKLIGRMFTYNQPTIKIAKSLGFREVGVLEKHGKLDGKWVDVLEMERLFPENQR